MTLQSGHRWDLGVVTYEEVRDSGENFFCENLPQGEYTFKYRLRASMTGAFKVSPATLQSLYAPEFTAYSTGDRIVIEGSVRAGCDAENRAMRGPWRPWAR